MPSKRNASMIRKLGVVLRDESFVNRGAFLEALLRRMKAIPARLRPEPTCLEFPEAGARIGISLVSLRHQVSLGWIHATAPSRLFPAMITLAEIRRLKSTPGRRSRKR